MGVTGAIFKSLTFDGESSRDYGVYISGSGVYNSPERDVEMITIPYRNGAFVQDNGRFNNIEITYPAGVYADTEEDFAEAVSNFRNFLSSKVGYCRLEDEYNPDEYRLAVYKSGLEVTPKMLKAGEFNIVFECKPQRFLKSGEVRTEKTSSSFTLTNPTLFESKPLLELYGTGSAKVNGANITSTPQALGVISLDLQEGNDRLNIVNRSQYNTGDAITLRGDTSVAGMNINIIYPTGTTITSVTKNSGTDTRWRSYIGGTRVVTLHLNGSFSGWTFNARNGESLNFPFSFTVVTSAGTETFSGSATITYTQSSSAAYFAWTRSSLSSSRAEITTYPEYDGYTATVDSSVPLSEPTYIDLETGDAYGIIGGQQVLVNDSVQLPAQLPVLNPGRNTITKTGLTKVAITPRWWKI